MSFSFPKPKRVSDDEVILARQDWEWIVTTFDGSGGRSEGDEEDLAAVRASRREDADFAAQLDPEGKAAIATTIPLEIVKAELDGIHPLRAWRNHRGWTQVDLSLRSGVGRDLIAQLETRKKSGSVDTLMRLAGALRVPVEAVIESPRG